MKSTWIDRILSRALKSQGFQSDWLQVRGGKVHYYQAGVPNRLPSILLLHGIAAQATHYGAVAIRLAKKGYHVVLPDMPSHGMSDDLDRTLTFDTLYSVFSQFADRLLPQPYVLVGNSMGGGIALRYALEYPERLKALVGLSPASMFTNQEEWEIFRKNLTITNREEAQIFAQKIYARPPWYLPFAIDMMLRAFQRKGVQEIIQSITVDDFKGVSNLGGLRVPTLIIWGTQDHLFPQNHSERLRAILPTSAEFETPLATGHCPQLDKPSWTTKRIIQFLDSKIPVAAL